MKKKYFIFFIIPIALGIIAFSFLSDKQQDNVINPENIIEEKNFDEIQEQKIKTDEEILKEIEDKYNEIDSENNFYNPPPRDWQSSGPFSIDRHEYILGEKIFMIAEGIPFDQSGKIVFLKQLNSTHYRSWKSLDFDGSKKSAFNVYFEPKLEKIFKLCEKNDLIGEWTILFSDTEYKNLDFTIKDQILPREEDKFEKIC